MASSSSATGRFPRRVSVANGPAWWKSLTRGFCIALVAARLLFFERVGEPSSAPGRVREARGIEGGPGETTFHPAHFLLRARRVVRPEGPLLQSAREESSLRRRARRVRRHPSRSRTLDAR